MCNTSTGLFLTHNSIEEILVVIIPIAKFLEPKFMLTNYLGRICRILFLEDPNLQVLQNANAYKISVLHIFLL